jgi:hypothetical protein
MFVSDVFVGDCVVLDEDDGYEDDATVDTFVIRPDLNLLSWMMVAVVVMIFVAIGVEEEGEESILVAVGGNGVDWESDIYS